LAGIRAQQRRLRRICGAARELAGQESKKLSFEQAAGIPIAAETDYRALHEVAGIKKGQTVLIHGAAGGVGSVAVQIAKAAGARVIGTASPNNREFLKQLGVDEFIDYKSQKSPMASSRRRRLKARSSSSK
jgi:NADPH:quinone reductase-like Zn-dependent oxidoreductase